MSEATNFDGLDENDLREYVKQNIGNPEKDLLTTYACLVLNSRHYRRQGKIKTALQYERHADLVYASLPKPLRW